MPLARQSTVVRGRVSGKIKPNRKPPMRKVTKRGAYRPAQKRNFMRKRGAVVETKRKTHEDLRDPTFFAGTGENPVQDHMEFKIYKSEHVMMNPLTYYLWSQGLSQSQHVGQAVTLKYLKQKIHVRFPQPSQAYTDESGTTSNQITPFIPQRYELIWGFVPVSLNLGGNAEYTGGPTANTVDLDQIKAHVNNRVQDYFNARKDDLRFIPKKDSNIRILGRRKVRPDMRYVSTAPPTVTDGFTTDSVVGTIPDYKTSVSWPVKGKKLWLEQTGNIDGGNKLIAMYPNYSALLPFCTLVNWNHDELKLAYPDTTDQFLRSPSIAWNDAIYFTDS